MVSPKSFILFGFILLGLFFPAICDLPIHCIHRSVSGKWQFEVEPLSSSSSSGPELCGYPQPDYSAFHFNGYSYHLKNTHSFQLELNEPNIVLDSQQKEVGIWTLVADQSLVIRLNKAPHSLNLPSSSAHFNTLTFSAFFSYQPKSPSNPSSTHEIDFVSTCSSTRIGWYWTSSTNNKGSKPIIHSSCFKATQIQALHSSESKSLNELIVTQSNQRNNRNPNGNDQQGPVQPGYSKPSLLQTGSRNNDNILQMNDEELLSVSKAKAKALNSFSLGSTPSPFLSADPSSLFVSNLEFIDYINNNPSNSWKASYSSSQIFHGSSMNQVYSMLGKNNLWKPKPFNDNNNNNILIESANMKTPIEAKTCLNSNLCSHLPKNFDWRNKNGVNYVSPIKQQKGCGSCYAVAITYAIESRIRIQSKNIQQPLLSAQELVSCSVSNQACDGGYPFLAGLHGERLGFVEESCAPYRASSIKCDQLHDLSHCKRYYLSNTRYIGGYFGGGNEVDMMEEIYANGPIVAAFDSPRSLIYYREGVFHSTENIRHQFQGSTEQQGLLNEWQHTSHAVAIVGWGEQVSGHEKIPYWIVKNTWGTSWGDAGYFKIRRGTNECAIESMSSAFDVLLS